MKIAGIIGGLAPQSTELFYHEFILNCQKRKEIEYPQLIINSINLWKFVRLLKEEKHEEEFLKREIEKISHHVDFVAIVCNTAHFIIEKLRKSTRVPLLGIHEEVCKRVAKSGVKKVGIIGTKTTVYHNFYAKELDKLRIEHVNLDVHEESRLNTLIFYKMLYGQGYDEMKKLLKVQVSLLEKKGCDGVILACTELPLFITQEDVNIKVFPSTNILAEAVVEKIFD